MMLLKSLLPSKTIAVAAIVALAVVAGIFLYNSIRNNAVLAHEKEVLAEENAKLVESAEANKEALRAVVATFSDIYSEYEKAKRVIDNRRTSESLRAQPTETIKQINKDMSKLFREIEEVGNE